MILLEFWLSYLYLNYNDRVKFIHNNYLEINLFCFLNFICAIIVGILFIDIINLFRLWLTIFAIHFLLVFIISTVNKNKYILNKEFEILELPVNTRYFNVVNKQHSKLAKVYYPDFNKKQWSKVKGNK